MPLLLRGLLGLAESPLYFCILFNISRWYEGPQHTVAIAHVTMSIVIGPLISTLVAPTILYFLDGMGNVAGWRWVFLLQGLMPCLLVPLVLCVMPNAAADERQTRWIAEPSERKRLVALQERFATPPPLLEGLRGAASTPASLCLALFLHSFREP